MKSLKSPKFLGTVLFVFSFLFINPNVQAQKNGNNPPLDHRTLNTIDKKIIDLEGRISSIEKEYQKAKLECTSCSAEKIQELENKYKPVIKDYGIQLNISKDKFSAAVDQMYSSSSIVELNETRIEEIGAIKLRIEEGAKLSDAIKEIDKDFVLALKKELMNRKVEQSEKIMIEFGYPLANHSKQNSIYINASQSKDEWVAMNPELYEELISTLKNTKLFLSTAELEILRTWRIDAK